MSSCGGEPRAGAARLLKSTSGSTREPDFLAVWLSQQRGLDIQNCPGRAVVSAAVVLPAHDHALAQG